MRNANRLLFRRDGGSNPDDLRLDAAESAWLKRELEWIDTEVYKQPYVGLQMREILPSSKNIPEWAKVHTWREMDMFGKAKVITAMGDDLPRVDIAKREVTKTIKTVGASYGYDWDEMLAASSQPGMHLDADRAFACKFAVESQVEDILAYGLSDHGLEGFFTLSGINTFTLGDKAKGGKTWGTLAAPNATGLEVYNDLVGGATFTVTNSKGVIEKVDIVLTLDAYAYAAGKPLSATDQTKALQAALSSPFINSIRPAYRATAAASNGSLANDTMMFYPKNPMFVCGVNTREYTPQPAQQKNMEWVINATAKCGGAVTKYPYLVTKATGFGA